MLSHVYKNVSYFFTVLYGGKGHLFHVYNIDDYTRLEVVND